MNSNEDVIAVLELALDMIEKNGWCQGGSGMNDDGQICVEVALSYARVSLGRDGWMEARKVVQSQVPERFRDHTNGYTSIAFYNDAPSTSLEDIKLLFKRSIESLEG